MFVLPTLLLPTSSCLMKGSPVPQYQYVTSLYTHCNTVITSHHSIMGLISTPELCVHFQPLLRIQIIMSLTGLLHSEHTQISSFVKMFSAPIILYLCVLQDTFVICSRQGCCEINLVIQYLLNMWIIGSQFVF